MGASFSRTLRALEASRRRRMLLWVALATIVLGAWVAWLLMARIAVYEIAEVGRVEARRAVHPISPAESGRVVAVNVNTGQHVLAGEVLVELDSESERLALEEGRARLSDLQGRLAALDAQLAVEDEATEADRDATRAAVREARAWQREAEARVERAEEHVSRVEGMVDRGLDTRDSLSQARAELASLEAEVEARQLTVRRLDREGGVDEGDRQVRIAELRSQRAELEGQRVVEEATVHRLDYAIERHLVRAPVNGLVGDLGPVRVGLVVESGQILGTVVPDGDLHVVAQFPTTAAGHLRNGQSARLRFPGYPWTQYGTVPARVTMVSREPVDGYIRLELELIASTPTAIPIEHGVPAVVEVEVEQVAPMELILRAAGKWVEREE